MDFFRLIVGFYDICSKGGIIVLGWLIVGMGIFFVKMVM